MEILLADEYRYRAAIEKAIAEKTMTASTYAMSEREAPKLQIVGGAAIIPITGPLTYRSDFWAWLFGGTSYTDLTSLIAMAESSSNVDQIIFAIDSPGGEVTGIQEPADAIYDCKKPTTGVIDPECASAALWLGSQCDRLVSVRSGLVGSLGVQAITKSYAGMLKEQGIDVKVFRAAISPNKNLGHPMEPRSEEFDKDMQARVDKWGERFVAAVARGRGVSTDVVLARFGQGKMLEADEAIAAGLIDAIGTVDSVLAEKPKRYRTATASGVSNRRTFV